MPYKYIVIKPSGDVLCETHKKRPEWREIQKYVEGPFQVLPYFTSLTYQGVKYSRGTAYCNENGWVVGLKPNSLATACWKIACPKGDPERMRIAGTILFVSKVKEEEESAKAG